MAGLLRFLRSLGLRDVEIVHDNEPIVVKLTSVSSTGKMFNSHSTYIHALEHRTLDGPVLHAPNFEMHFRWRTVPTCVASSTRQGRRAPMAERAVRAIKEGALVAEWHAQSSGGVKLLDSDMGVEISCPFLTNFP